MTAPGRKRKIAVIGGGPAALSAVFHLTNFPGWDRLYDVTVYTPGHRLGGKATTARGAHGRVEELGIHILQGWYENTFRILRQAYAERRARGLSPGSDRSWHEALEKDASTFLTTRVGEEREWSSWTLVFPQDDLLPGTPDPVPALYHLRRIAALLAHFALGSPFRARSGLRGWLAQRCLTVLFPECPVQGEGAPAFAPPPPSATLEQVLEHYIAQASFRLDDNSELPLTRLQHALATRAVHAASRAFASVRGAMASRARRGSELETIWQALDWLLTSTRGALADAWEESGQKLVFSRINGVDYRAWLAAHGAHPATLESGLVKFMYYGSFANKLSRGRQGTLAADIALRMVINTLFYKGSLVWKTKKGSGTSMVVPIFEVLRARGVQFRFFHRLLDAQPHEGRIARLRLAEEARLAPGRASYDPLLYVDGDPDFAPAPDWQQLHPQDVEAIRSAGVNLEASWSGWQAPAVHELAAGRDFDDVILAIPVSALAASCPSILAENARWQTMVATVPTVATFSAQAWLRPSQRELGYRAEAWGLRERDEPNSVIYEDPVYSWTDMTGILQAERWPQPNAPRTLAYFCGTLPDELPVLPTPEAPQLATEQRERLVRTFAGWLGEQMGWFWPAAIGLGAPAFDYELLAIPEEAGEVGEERLRRQFFAVNSDPSNLYVLACPGTDAARLRADESGYENLYLAGDWTNFGLNVGHLEGACVSGIRAALAILRDALSRERAER